MARASRPKRSENSLTVLMATTRSRRLSRLIHLSHPSRADGTSNLIGSQPGSEGQWHVSRDFTAPNAAQKPNESPKDKWLPIIPGSSALEKWRDTVPRDDLRRRPDTCNHATTQVGPREVRCTRST